MTSSIRKGLLQFIFSGAYMKRWNDKLRPGELIEIDKQAHKMIVAWCLCQLAGEKMAQQQRLELESAVVEGGIFDYLFRLVITDIKPVIFYRIKENPDHYRQLAKWATKEMEPHLRPLGEPFWERLTSYVAKPRQEGLAADILNAAHQYASAWEFRLLRPLNEPFDDEMLDIDARFTSQLASFAHLPGMKDLIAGLPAPGGLPSYVAAGGSVYGKKEGAVSAFSRFANLCGQLRFQKRWSQTPRIPETSVMGHMFLVACYAYCLSLALDTCTARRVNNFFCGLFHDLPELLTRDIISPVKKSFASLGKMIRQYEEDELELRVFGPLKEDGFGIIVDRLGYYLGIETGSEFNETIIVQGKVEKVDFAALQEHYNKDSFDPKDGDMIKSCDILAAYIEAYTAMRNGIASDHIQQAFWRMRVENAQKTLGPLHMGAVFHDFD